MVTIKPHVTVISIHQFSQYYNSNKGGVQGELRTLNSFLYQIFGSPILIPQKNSINGYEC